MSGETWPPRCHECGLFMSYAEMDRAINYTPFGGTGDTEPPDEEWIHAACWDAMNDDGRALIDRIAWGKPWDRREVTP